jgi:excisionase family DNA binding protein
VSTLPRMRTIPQAFAEIKRLDPDTALSETTFRKMVKRGEIPIIQVGSRRLINLDILFERLSEISAQMPNPQPKTIGIHPINI